MIWKCFCYLFHFYSLFCMFKLLLLFAGNVLCECNTPGNHRSYVIVFAIMQDEAASLLLAVDVSEASLRAGQLESICQQLHSLLDTLYRYANLRHTHTHILSCGQLRDTLRCRHSHWHAQTITHTFTPRTHTLKRAHKNANINQLKTSASFLSL